MFCNPLRRAVAMAMLLPALGVLPAQSAEKPAVAAPPMYRSAFDNYRTWRAEEAAADWRQANDEMGQLGGHAGHLRGAPQNATPQSRDGMHERMHGSEPMRDQERKPGHNAPMKDPASQNKESGQ